MFYWRIASVINLDIDKYIVFCKGLFLNYIIKVNLFYIDLEI